ncbi:protein IMPACT-like [Saccostrea echinata]|uniref:protein IMPACT-like n=1 Tax=Saccostrea echinata TaxID=191078 RepID=UPI002A80DD13|nr:protein IMPACT-like [Saccostrea echinata]
MTQSDKEKLQQISMSTMDCSDEGNTFKAAAATVETYNQVRNFYKKIIIDPAYSTAEHNILVYRFKDNTGAIHEGHNDDGEYGAGRRLVKVLRSLNVTNKACVISRFYGKHLGFRRFQIIENLTADIVLAHSG